MSGFNFRLPDISQLSQLSRSPLVLAAAGALTGLVVLRSANQTLSRNIFNNWTTDTTWDWKKELAVVTGGSSGIGAEIVRQLAEHGIKVLVLDVNEPKELLPNCHFYHFDCSSSSSIQSTAALIKSTHGDPTILCNNAGVGFPKPILERTEAMVRKTFDINVISHFLIVQEFLPAMIARNHGHIVTTASAASFGPQIALVDYAASKAGALAFHEGLSQELKWFYKADKVRVSILHPGFVRTALTAKARTNEVFEKVALQPDGVAALVVKQILSGYGGQLFAPPEIWSASLVRGLPLWLQVKSWDPLSKAMVHINKLGQ